MKFVYFRTNDRCEIERIRREYNLPSGMSVNYEVRCELDGSQLLALQHEVAKGSIEIREKPDKAFFRSPKESVIPKVNHTKNLKKKRK